MAQEPDVVLSAGGLKKTYASAAHASRGMNVQLRPGETHAIPGDNGADDVAAAE
jgi:ABC-type sugar transport system ATPase subunit